MKIQLSKGREAEVEYWAAVEVVTAAVKLARRRCQVETGEVGEGDMNDAMYELEAKVMALVGEDYERW